MSRDESLLIVASYFWSDALNAFLFGHGLMAPTLADVLVLTGLDISSLDILFGHRYDKLSHQLKTKSIGRWSGYITEHKKEGTVGQREHVSFLNMWLEKFFFCGQTFGPTANYQIVAELLAAGNRIPLGKCWKIPFRCGLPSPSSSSSQLVNQFSHRYFGRSLVIS
jgi:hypothetical protein